MKKLYSMYFTYIVYNYTYIKSYIYYIESKLLLHHIFDEKKFYFSYKACGNQYIGLIVAIQSLITVIIKSNETLILMRRKRRLFTERSARDDYHDCCQKSNIIKLR